MLMFRASIFLGKQYIIQNCSEVNNEFFIYKILDSQ